jgi:hypothetical protein
MTPLHWILMGAMLAPILILLGIVWVWRWVRSWRKEREPVSEKLLRPPAESTRRQLEKLDEQINDTLLWFLFAPPIVAVFLLIPNPALTASSRVGVVVILVIAGAITFAILAWRLIRLLNRRRNYRLGFAGERATAEELNQLMLDGCRVYHDVPMDPYGNIDHVILSSTGVYAVETKARRKRKVPGKRDHEVVFDGKVLTFPNGIDTKALQQAKRQADQLRVFLSKAVGEPVKVGAILTFPGWLVINRAKSEIKVLNPKNIRSAIQEKRIPELPKQLIDRIAYQLDQRCRDVEF